ncbi:MAG: GNAT family N-acetyltransferase [Allosphingosinicella sp.]
MRGIVVRRNEEALAVIDGEAVAALTEAATAATFYVPGLTPTQIEANRRIPPLAAQVYRQAGTSGAQHLAIAFRDDRPLGFVIATRHGPGDHELDWLMVHPDAHGSGLSAMLMREGMGWLGTEAPMWLTVLRHNDRAIAFYRRFGFEIDRAAVLDRPVPSWIMRRPPGPLPPEQEAHAE